MLETFILDSLLNTVLLQDVYLAIRTDGAPGAGTSGDAFNCAGTATDPDPAFDKIMRQIPEGTTMRLGPGIYFTNGYNTGYDPDSTTSPKGWRPKNRCRIIGSGLDTSILKITDGAPNSVLTSAVGGYYQLTSHFLEGFEISNIGIDCNFSSASATASTGGIAISGRNIFVSRVHVKNFGAKGPKGLCISVGQAYVNTAVTPPALAVYNIPFNCVIAECTVDSPASGSTAPVVGLHLTSNTPGYYHQTCVVRDCYVDFADPTLTYDYHGAELMGGRGTIFERNRICNCLFGGPGVGNGTTGSICCPTLDLIIRKNVFVGVRNPIFIGYYGDQPATVIGIVRVIVLKNQITWPDSASMPVVSGITVKRYPATLETISQIIICENSLRRINNTPNGSETAIWIEGATRAIIQNNLIDVTDPTKAVVHNNGTYTKPFNNRSSNGTLFRGYDGINHTYDPELSVFVDDALLVL
jgi:hypothetical protein